MHLGQASGRGFAVADGQITSGFQHGLDHFIEADAMATIADQSVFSAIHGPRRRKRITLDAWCLNEPQNRIAGESEVMLKCHFRGIFALLR